MEICVIVLGDIARSPRMLNHVSCLLDQGYKVKLIGYTDSLIPERISNHPNLAISSLRSKALSSIKILSGKLFIVYAFIRILAESLQLFFILLKNYKSKIFLIQNPPSMPVFAIAYAVSCICNTKVVVDWHNYAWSLLKIARRGNIIVKSASFYEWIFGKLVDKGFCVSENMRKDLLSKGITATTLYDRPFPRPSSQKNMKKALSIPEDFFFIVSSTSWTIDEDFSIVINALDILSNKPLKIFLVITGKGPLQNHYKDLIKTKQWKNIRIEMAWLETEDYPEVLKQADLGICLHVSSSGVDLPMKIVDMQEAELPALAFKYLTIHEFVKEGINGELFQDSEELAHKIEVKIIQKLIKSPKILEKYKENLRDFRNNNSWIIEWNNQALPIFREKSSITIRFMMFWIIVVSIIIKLI